MLLLNQLKCEKCGKKALGLLSDVWLCGDCMIEFDKKRKNAMRELILEE